MILKEDIRAEIADKLVRVVAPAMFFSMIVSIVCIIVIGESQYHRLPPSLLVMAAMILAWFFAKKGRPKVGAGIILSSICLAIFVAMILSGGVRAPAFIGSIVCVTVFVILYGAKAGIVFALGTLSMGGIFIWLESIGVISKVDQAPDIFYLVLICIYISMQIVFILIPIQLMFKALTESRKNQKELEQAVFDRQQSQKELQSILNKTPDIIYRLNPEGEVTFISEAVRKYGYEPGDFIGKQILDFVHPNDREKSRRRLHERRSGDRGSTNMELRFVNKKALEDHTMAGGDHERWSVFQISSEGIYTEDQNNGSIYLGVQGIARDVSETKEYETQITRLAAVVEQASEDVVITDPEGFILYVNPKFEILTGYSSKEVIGKTPGIFKSGRHGREFYADMWTTIKNGNTWNGKIWNKIKDGSLILQDVTITPIFDASNLLTGYASVRRDITEHDKLESQLKQSQKMEAIGTLAGGIAHDFNNILGAIIGYSELALIDLNDSKSVKTYVAQILKAGSRAKDLVRQILMFSRQTKQEKLPVNITTLAKEVIKLLRATLPANIEIKTSFSEGIGMVLSDPSQIHQIFMNLCTNAAHAMKEKGGTLAVNIKQVQLTPYTEEAPASLETGPYLKLKISDTGHGIPKDIQDKIFDPFFTTKSREEGTGMGLSVVYGIVESHGGAISMESKIGEGTTFNVYLPVIEIKTEEHSMLKNEIPKGSEHILFIEDEPALLELGQVMLERLGYKVTASSDSGAAWKEFQESTDRFDLVVTDRNMPGMSGLELSKRIISLKPDIPIIMCTGFSEEITTRQAESIGVKRVLHKPVISKDMGAAIRELLDN